MVETAAPTWTAIDEPAGLWGIDRYTPQGWHLRSVAVRLPDGGALVYSPLARLPDADPDGLAALGGAAVVLAPNHFHHLAVAEYCEQFPDAVAVCSDVARPRVARKTRVEMGALAAAAERLPDHVEVLTPPGLRTGEVWLRVATDAGVTWVVSDAFFSVSVQPRGVMGLILRLTGTTPGLRIGRTFTGLAVGDRRDYRAWLDDQLARDRPVRLVPSHGAVIADGDPDGDGGGDPDGGADAGDPPVRLADRLRAVIDSRLS